MTWLLVVYIVTPRPLLSLYGIICVTWYTSHLPESDCGGCWYTSQRVYISNTYQPQSG